MTEDTKTATVDHQNGKLAVEQVGRDKRSPSVVSRGGWGNRWEFLLSCVGLSVGIGNVWRFPYLAYANGGAGSFIDAMASSDFLWWAFLIPYLIMLLLAGKPLYFLEMAFGQFAGVGPVGVWSCLPIAKGYNCFHMCRRVVYSVPVDHHVRQCGDAGVGWAMVLVCLVVVIYYCVIMAYTIFYIASTFQAVVPWSYCDPSWAANTLCLNRSDLVGHFTLLLNWCSLCLNRSDLVGHFTLLLYWCSLCLNRSDLVGHFTLLLYWCSLCLNRSDLVGHFTLLLYWCSLCLNRSDLVGHFTLLLYWCSLCLNRSDLVGHFTLLLYWCSLCLNRSDLVGHFTLLLYWCSLCLNRSDLVGYFTLLLYWCSLCLNRSDLVGYFTLLLYWCSLCLNRSDLPLTSSVQVNATLRNATKGAISASQAYWDRCNSHYVLEKTASIADPGGLKWDLCLCLLLSWIIVIVCLIKGIKTSGKVVYFAATFPYIILVILLVTGLLQPGAFNGVMYFIKPDWDKLLKIEVPSTLFGRRRPVKCSSPSPISMGALIMYSSYNGFRHNIFRDAMVVSVLDTLTSIVAGLVIFSILGAMAYESDQDISTVVNSGPGLAFVAYPEALTRLPCPQLWSFFFFFMLFVLGLDSEFALLENVISSVLDEFPKLRKHRTWFCLGLASCCYLIGLSCMSRGGHYVFEMMDNYGGNASLFFVAVMEIISIAWIYGQ
ncbi:hypothetical protein LAZ67_15000131 [Cordylochernes scorpioides]|uniref:Transporter n=1 Tax=Cordylochernes scorpioides TaxID=51811 RepID=A0ABY6L8W7_9ARAC|nr:hypothetical protein LAZ67_15000131 [Cordylochernes scorpioides]